MSRKYNFFAGPATMPLPVLEELRDELVDYHGIGLSMVENSHRSKEYDKVHNEAVANVRELLGLTDEFHVMLLGGGATYQFSMIPHNLLQSNPKCDFTLTGTWAKKAYADAKIVGQPRLIFDGTDTKFATLPDPAGLKVDQAAAYAHFTSNETIGGIQWHDWPDTGDVPLVCDMSSDIFSRRLPLDKFGIIYAGAQKNLGPSGVTLVIMRDDVLQSCSDDMTAYMSYKIHAAKNSLYNTPPVFPIYAVGKVLKWVKAQGGLTAMEELAAKRSSALYDVIDGYGDFYRSPVPKECRSTMNVVWRCPTEELEQKFLAEAPDRGMLGLKGHRSVGGCRASIYNAMPLQGALDLAQWMKDFAEEHG